MRVYFLFVILLVTLLGCGEKLQTSEGDVGFETIEKGPEPFTEKDAEAILTKNVPSTLLNAEFETGLILPFYYDNLNAGELDEIEEKWFWDQLTTIADEPVKGVIVELESFLKWQLKVVEEVLVLNSEIDGLVSITGIKENNLYEESVILHEDENSIIHIFAGDAVRVHYFEYDSTDHQYLLYQADINSFSDLGLDERKTIAFELLRNAKNLTNKAHLNSDINAISWKDYANAQPKAITQQMIRSFEGLNKQVTIFMDIDEKLPIKLGENYTFGQILRPDQEDRESISNFLFAIEAGIDEDIAERKINLSNTARNFLGTPYNKDSLTFKVDKHDATYQITMSYPNYDEEMITESMVVSFLRTNDKLYFFRSGSSSKMQMDYHSKIYNYYIKNGTLAFNQNR